MSGGLSGRAPTGQALAVPVEPASSLAASRFDPSRFAHFGDPCVYCRVPHDDVPVGPCKARLSVLGYAKVETRWDGVEHYRWLTSDGRAHEVWSHVTNRLPYYHFGLREDFQNTPPWLARLINPVSEQEAVALAKAIEASGRGRNGLDAEGTKARAEGFAQGDPA